MFERIPITPRQLYLFPALQIKLSEDTEAEVYKWSSHQVLSNISKILLEKYMCWSLFLRKLEALSPANLLKRDSNTGISCEIAKIFKSFFLTEHLRQLVFKISNSNILFNVFSGIPVHNPSYAQLISACNSHNDKLYLTMHSLTKYLFRQSVSVTDLGQTRRGLI